MRPALPFNLCSGAVGNPWAGADRPELIMPNKGDFPWSKQSLTAFLVMGYRETGGWSLLEDKANWGGHRAGFLLPVGGGLVSSASTIVWSSMEIRIESLLEGARRARGTVVIVDVFRAFTTAAVALARGASRIVMVPEPQEALRLRDLGVGDICVGEVNGIRPEGFDFGNSPHELMQAPLEGRVVIQSTRAGTVGVAAATQATAIYAASFVVAGATAEAIRRDAPAEVTIVAMGWNATVRTDEDEQCALYLRNLLQGRRPDPEAVRTLVLAGGEVAKFYDPGQPHFHPEDCEIALQVDQYDFAIRIGREGDHLVARRHG